MSQFNPDDFSNIDPRKLTPTQLRAIRKHNEDNRKFEESTKKTKNSVKAKKPSNLKLSLTSIR